MARRNRFLTTSDSGHNHSWLEGEEFTKTTNGHKHMVRANVALPLFIGGHSHKIKNVRR